MARNPDSALKLGQAKGAAIVAAKVAALEVYEYSARQVKQSVVGTGAADKAQVQHMVKSLLKLPANPQADAADALAVALCHGHTWQSLLGDVWPSQQNSAWPFKMNGRFWFIITSISR